MSSLPLYTRAQGLREGGQVEAELTTQYVDWLLRLLS